MVYTGSSTTNPAKVEAYYRWNQKVYIYFRTIFWMLTKDNFVCWVSCSHTYYRFGRILHVILNPHFRGRKLENQNSNLSLFFCKFLTFLNDFCYLMIKLMKNWRKTDQKVNYFNFEKPGVSAKNQSNVQNNK